MNVEATDFPTARNAPGIAGFLRISDVIQDVNETIPVE